MTFAELVAAVQRLTSNYAQVSVSESFGGHMGPPVFQWKIYVDRFAFGAEAPTAEGALEDLRKRLAGDVEQQVDPIEPPAPVVPHVPATEPDVEHPETEPAPPTLGEPESDPLPW